MSGVSTRVKAWNKGAQLSLRKQMSLPEVIHIHRPTKELEAATLISFFHKRVPQRCDMTGNEDKG